MWNGVVKRQCEIGNGEWGMSGRFAPICNIDKEINFTSKTYKALIVSLIVRILARSAIYNRILLCKIPFIPHFTFHIPHWAKPLCPIKLTELGNFELFDFIFEIALLYLNYLYHKYM